MTVAQTAFVQEETSSCAAEHLSRLQETLLWLVQNRTRSCQATAAAPFRSGRASTCPLHFYVPDCLVNIPFVISSRSTPSSTRPRYPLLALSMPPRKILDAFLESLNQGDQRSGRDESSSTTKKSGKCSSRGLREPKQRSTGQSTRRHQQSSNR